MTESLRLTLARTDGADGAEPAGWSTFVRENRLPAFWEWQAVRSYAVGRRDVLAGVVADDRPRALLTGRLTGPRLGSGARAIAGIADLDCLLSASMPGVVWPEETIAEERREILETIRRDLREQTGGRARGVCLRQVGRSWLPEALTRLSVAREGGPIAELANEFDSFDAYLATLSRGRRQSVRRVLRRFESDDEVRIESGPSAGLSRPLDRAEVKQLYAHAVLRNRRGRLLKPRLLPDAVADQMLDSPQHWWLTYRDRGSGALKAFLSAWAGTSTLYGAGWGMEAVEEGGLRHAWFDANARMIRLGIEQGCSTISGGQGTSEQKADLGYRMRRQWAVLSPLG